MLDARVFLKEFAKHVASCKSAPTICGANASFESWFRAEIIPVLWDLKIPADSIETNYTYPGARNKADLCVTTTDGNIVFELKSFVSGQDANKKEGYPSQIKSLENLIAAPDVVQVVTFMTFIGYSAPRMSNYLTRFFQSPAWDIVGPEKLVEPHSLFAVIASLTKQSIESIELAKIKSTSDTNKIGLTFEEHGVQTRLLSNETSTNPEETILSDRIRQFVLRRYIEPARQKKISTFTVRTGDVHSAMKLNGRMPAVCSAIGSIKFRDVNKLKFLTREGPMAGSNVFFTFEILY